MSREGSRNRRNALIFAGIGFLFFFFQVTGRELAKRGNITWNAQFALCLLAVCLVGGAITAFLAGWVRGKIARNVFVLEEKPKIRNRRRVWLIRFVLIAACWLPTYLAYYPGICAYDVTIQTGQIVDGAYNDHHPLAHTLLLAGGMKAGKAVFGDVNTGIAVLVLIQMLLLAGVFAWGILVLEERGLRFGWILCLQLLCMFYPFHWYMSVSVIKDIPFSIFFFLQMIALFEVIKRRKKRPDGYDFLLFGSSVGMQLFRNNGRYALLVLTAVLIVAFVFGKSERRFWGKLCLNSLAALVVGTMFLSALFRLAGAEQGDRREMLSMPIQQLARCMIYHGGVGVLPEDDGTMGSEEKALIQDFLLNEGYREYRPEISDPVKRHTNTYVVRYRTVDFVKVYGKLLSRYPGDFVNAALAVNAGYFYVGDESHSQVNKNGRDSGLGYVQTRWVEAELNPRGIYKDSKWKGLHNALERWADDNAYRKIPLLKYLFVPGVFFWLYLLLAGCLAARREYALCVPLALVLGYYLTLFLGPVVQLRYLYPMMCVLPFAAAFSLTDGAKNIKGEMVYGNAKEG